jgi:hypothetical protein
MTSDAWITDRPPTEDDVDIKDCIFVPEYRPGIQQKAQSVTLDQYFSIFKEGYPWRATKRGRKHKRNPIKQNQLPITMPEVCSACRFYRNGECRRRAPVEGSGGSWPKATDNDWCGEWEARK